MIVNSIYRVKRADRHIVSIRFDKSLHDKGGPLSSPIRETGLIHVIQSTCFMICKWSDMIDCLWIGLCEFVYGVDFLYMSLRLSGIHVSLKASLSMDSINNTWKLCARHGMQHSWDIFTGKYLQFSNKGQWLFLILFIWLIEIFTHR